MSQHMRNRVISREHYDKLHDGMKRAARNWNWTIVDEPDRDDPKLVTLLSLGLELPPEPVPVEPVARLEVPLDDVVWDESDTEIVHTVVEPIEPTNAGDDEGEDDEDEDDEDDEDLEDLEDLENPKD